MYWEIVDVVVACVECRATEEGAIQVKYELRRGRHWWLTRVLECGADDEERSRHGTCEDDRGLIAWADSVVPRLAMALVDVDMRDPTSVARM